MERKIVIILKQYIKKGLYGLYYAFYVILEGIFKVSHSWNPIISITGMISLLVALPLISIIRLLSLCWLDVDIPVKTATIICATIWSCLYWLLYHYYLSAYEKIEQKFQKDSIWTKIAFGMLAIAVICMSIYINSWVSELYLIKWKSLNPSFGT